MKKFVLTLMLAATCCSATFVSAGDQVANKTKTHTELTPAVTNTPVDNSSTSKPKSMIENVQALLQTLTPTERKLFLEKLRTIRDQWNGLTTQEQTNYVLFMLAQKLRWVEMSNAERQTEVTKIRQELLTENKNAATVTASPTTPSPVTKNKK